MRGDSRSSPCRCGREAGAFRLAHGGVEEIERLPRRAISNGGRWPRAYRAPIGPAPRTPLDHPRDKKVLVHESVEDLSRIGQREGMTVERYPLCGRSGRMAL